VGAWAGWLRPEPLASPPACFKGQQRSTVFATDNTTDWNCNIAVSLDHRAETNHSLCFRPLHEAGQSSGELSLPVVNFRSEGCSE